MCYKWRHHSPITPFVTTSMSAGSYLSLCVYFMSGSFIILIKNNYNIKGIEICEYFYLYIAYTNDAIFFLKDEKSIIHLSEKFKLFSHFS